MTGQQMIDHFALSWREAIEAKVRADACKRASVMSGNPVETIESYLYEWIRRGTLVQSQGSSNSN
jgi:hypothetical protein